MDLLFWQRFPNLTTIVCTLVILSSLYNAFHIRTYALHTFGYVIHEFDPWFNFRATEYLLKVDFDLKRFFEWFDHRSWYPLGRPVGTTIYPGMQITSVAIYEVLHALPRLLGVHEEAMFQTTNSSIYLDNAQDRDEFFMDFWRYGWKFQVWRLGQYTINDICCLIPCWFGILASLFTGLLGQESTGSKVVGALSVWFMAIIPAHIMRSVGGGYDNESVAMTAMTMTFYLWVKSLREPRRSGVRHGLVWGFLTGLAYIYMVAAWGGYIFVLNMVAFHAFSLCLTSAKYGVFTKSEDFSYQLIAAYSAFYVIGTFGAIQIPVVGLAPLKSLEQLFGLVVLLLCGAIAFVQFVKKIYIIPTVTAKHAKKAASSQGSKALFLDEEIEEEYLKFLFVFGGIGIAIFGIVVAVLYPTGYFGPLSSRIRGLFVPHTRTGNPLVDSVAEHRAANSSAYIRYLHFTFILAPIGLILLARTKRGKLKRDQNSFLMLYSVCSYYFSSKMVRLMILNGPVASCLSAIAIEAILDWCYRQFVPLSNDTANLPEKGTKEIEVIGNQEADDTASMSNKKKHQKKVAGNKSVSSTLQPSTKTSDNDPFNEMFKDLFKLYDESKDSRKIAAILIILALVRGGFAFFSYCQFIAERSSHPSLMFKAKTSFGTEVMVDDYREAYWWLRDNTPYDTRVMAWWDYGYQISGIADRITIADGNTWNHEHIATLGRCLVSEEHVGHEMIKHLADYLLVWTGGGGDDLAKSPHIARISNSVYTSVCGLDDPLCKKFGFEKNDRSQPSDMMKHSVIYTLHSGEPDPALWEKAYESKHGKVKIWKVKGVDEESKAWTFDPANYICDGSDWLCRGQYPPKFVHYLHDKKDFQQLEDFNVKADDDSHKEYQKKYHEAFSSQRQPQK